MVPGLLATARYLFGPAIFPEPVQPVVGGLLGSLVYGGIPYCVLALWATWRMGSMSEREIKRLMAKAPFLMIALMALFWFLAGLRVGQPKFIVMGPLFAFLIIPAGYGYMGLVLLLREELGERLH